MALKAKWPPKAVKLFQANKQRVYTRKQLAELLITNAEALGTPRTLTVQRFIHELQKVGELRTVEVAPAVGVARGARAANRRPESGSAPAPYKSFSRYVWGNASAYEMALSLRAGSYLSHATAVFLHGLTSDIPRTVYANKEQSEKPESLVALTQQGIDRAFANKARTSNYIFEFEGTRIVLLSGKNTGNLEVSEVADSTGRAVPTTKLERALVDITVRPIYAGGVFNVLEAYRGAHGRVSVPTLVATLRKLAYAYPYHQAVGFYMQRAGYAEAQLQRLKALGTDFDFYLTNQIPNPRLDPEWRVYYPDGL